MEDVVFQSASIIGSLSRASCASSLYVIVAWLSLSKEMNLSVRPCQEFLLQVLELLRHRDVRVLLAPVLAWFLERNKKDHRTFCSSPPLQHTPSSCFCFSQGSLSLYLFCRTLAALGFLKSFCWVPFWGLKMGVWSWNLFRVILQEAQRETTQI